MDSFVYPAEALEVRRKGRRRTLRGRFPYRSTATLRDRGKVRKERFEPKAFEFAVKDTSRPIHLLIGHDFNRPLAVRPAIAPAAPPPQPAARPVPVAPQPVPPAGPPPVPVVVVPPPAARPIPVPVILPPAEEPKPTLELELADTEEGLLFEVELPEDTEELPTYYQDLLKLIALGLVVGVSPGFKVPPLDVVPDAEALEPEPGNADVLIRIIRAAVLFELSLVTRPAYKESLVDLRSQDFRPVAARRRVWL